MQERSSICTCTSLKSTGRIWVNVPEQLSVFAKAQFIKRAE